jgi:hypothetical protein
MDCYFCQAPARKQVVQTEVRVCDRCLVLVGLDAAQLADKFWLRQEEVETLLEHARERAKRTSEKLAELNARSSQWLIWGG